VAVSYQIGRSTPVVFACRTTEVAFAPQMVADPLPAAPAALVVSDVVSASLDVFTSPVSAVLLIKVYVVPATVAIGVLYVKTTSLFERMLSLQTAVSVMGLVPPVMTVVTEIPPACVVDPKLWIRTATT